MSNITTIGLDIAKSVFQIHGVDAGGEVIVRRKLTRGLPGWDRGLQFLALLGLRAYRPWP